MADFISFEEVTNALEEVCDRTCPYSKPNRAVMCGGCPLGHAYDAIENLAEAQKSLHYTIDEDEDEVELSAEEIVNLPHDTAIAVVEYILGQWYEAVHKGETI